jgi:exopolysaccharide biosynthesis polyprenyl glycosylphosphotransferase
MRWITKYNLNILRSRRGTRWRVWDLAVGVAAFAIAFLLTPHKSAMPAPYYIFVVGCMYGAMLTVFARLCAVPVPGHRMSSYELLTSCILAVLLTYVFFSVIVGLVLLRAYGRYIVVITTGFSLLGILGPRWILMRVLRLQPLNVIIYGAGSKGQRLAARIRRDRHFRVLGFLDNNPEYHGKDVEGCRVLGSIKEMNARRLHQLGVDIVVISVAAKKLLDENAAAILELPLSKIEVLNQGAFLEYYFKEISVEYGCPQWFASAPSVPGNPSIFAAKRLIDAAGSLAALILVLPLFPLIALAIKLDSHGPVLFKQKRVGRNGRNFDIYKFRTMVRDAEKNGAQWAVEKDPRVTRIGRILRRTRLDEVPQLWNVLKGDMSLVGPRPERPEFVEELAKEIPYYEQRHLVPPGLTGWAQVRYRYGASKEDAVRKLQYELYYVRHLSIMFDIEILLRTIPLVARGSR